MLLVLRGTGRFAVLMYPYLRPADAWQYQMRVDFGHPVVAKFVGSNKLNNQPNTTV